ncbi:hypothetical protein LIS77_06685 [Cytobacillus firmus]|nr:hypothetical protein [Cytobacillus firmus]USK40178.1 hypothetical protein LIS77_06685 [Cytobacillus firmus]
MDPNQLPIDMDLIVGTLTSKIAKLERENAVLLAQQDALVKIIEEKKEAK